MTMKEHRLSLVLAVATLMVLFGSAPLFAEIVPNTDNLNIGPQCPGGCITDVVTLTNQGSTTETINSWTFSDPGYGGFSLVDPPGLPYTLDTLEGEGTASVDFVVQFCPPADSMFVNSLDFSTSINAVYVNLIGVGYGPCAFNPLIVYPEDREWNIAAEEASATSSHVLIKSIKITNPAGNPPASIYSIAVTSGISAYFEINNVTLLYPGAHAGCLESPWGCPFSVGASPSMPLVLQPGMSVIIDLQFYPEEVGLFEGTLNVSTNVPGPDASIDITLSGEGLSNWTAEIYTLVQMYPDEFGTFLIPIDPEEKGGPITGWTVENMSNISAYFINPEVDEEISIYGQLVDATSPGSFDLYVDPEGVLIKYEVVLTPYSAVQTVAIDIKPGSDPNSIHCINRNAIIAVAILTTGDFDATTVDHTTVTFAEATETHVSDKTGAPLRHEEDVDGDGDIDLVLHFRLGETDLTCDSTEGTLNGQTFSGQTIVGTDSIRMVGK